MPDHPAYAIPAPDRAEDAARAWEAHLDAGRIGRPVRTSDDVARNLAAWDALFRAGCFR